MKTITLQELNPQDDPGNGWHMIEACGMYPTTYDPGIEGQPVLRFDQAITPEVVADIVANYDEELMVDKDHLSHDDDQTTEACGWTKELAAILDGETVVGYAARIEWTSLGLPLVQGKIYKRFSTEYPPPAPDDVRDGQYKPLRLVGLALTNRSHNKGQRPITNRQEPAPQTQTPNPNMEELAEINAALGLTEEASQQERLDAIAALRETTAAAQEAEAEAILNSEGADDMQGEEREMMKEELIKNHDRAIKVLRNRAARKKTATTSAPLYQRPLTNRSVLGDQKAGVKDNAVRLRKRAHEIQAASNCGYFEAVGIASRELGISIS